MPHTSRGGRQTLGHSSQQAVCNDAGFFFTQTIDVGAAEPASASAKALSDCRHVLAIDLHERDFVFIADARHRRGAIGGRALLLPNDR
jgi:hypothetical protein